MVDGLVSSDVPLRPSPDPAHDASARRSRSRSRRLRVVTYNILLGGLGREELIASVLERCDADVVALQEASDLGVVDRLAARLGMNVAVGEPSDPASRLNLAVLSRPPIRRYENHRHAGMLRAHLACELRLGGRVLPQVRIHVVHLAARFGERNNGEARRMREMARVLDDIEGWPQAPHLIVGDFNAVAPGDQVAATAFFARMAQLREAGLVVRGEDGFEAPIVRPDTDDPAHDARWLAVGIHPRLDIGIPRLPWMVGPATSRLPSHALVDRVLGTRIRRDTVEHLGRVGYTDSYRALSADAGATCATWMPAARIDYIFADPVMAERLHGCEVVGGPPRPDPTTLDASDHFPVLAEFRW